MLVKSQVKYIQSLGHKKFRAEEDAFVAEGPKLVNELLNEPTVSLLQLFATETWMQWNEAMLMQKRQADIHTVTAPELERLSSLTTPHEVLAVFRKPHFPEPDPRNHITLLLEAIQDPGNMGTLLRTADWFGVNAMVCSDDSADIFNPKVVQASMGSIARVAVQYTSLKKFVGDHPAVPLYATVLDGEDVRNMNSLPEAMVLVGNEARGISAELLELAHHRVTIPRKGNAESLNAAVAAGIVLSYIAGR